MARDNYGTGVYECFELATTDNHYHSVKFQGDIEDLNADIEQLVFRGKQTILLYDFADEKIIFNLSQIIAIHQVPKS